MKEKSIDINRVYWLSLPWVILGAPLIVLLYKVCHGANYKEILYQNPFILLYFILALVVMVFVHELIHGLCFALYAKKGIKNVQLGMMWKTLTPYCHCKEPLKVWQYGVALLMPTIVLGIIPLLIGFVAGHFFVFLFGLILLMGGIGDIIAFKMLRSVPAGALVIDHPDKVGFYYEIDYGIVKL